jgi:flagellar motor protein MotB
MTSLFFVMLVLFVLTQIIGNNTIKKLEESQIELEEAKKITQRELERIKSLQEAVKSLPQNYFRYDSTYKRFSLVKEIHFARDSANISKKEDKTYLENAGEAIQELIYNLRKDTANKNVRYVVIVEGMASKDKLQGNLSNNEEINYPLSYRRAWAVQKLWKEKNILTDGSVDLQIAGSGIGGLGRDKNYEHNNQRILIHIIPKIEVGDIKVE